MHSTYLVIILSTLLSVQAFGAKGPQDLKAAHQFCLELVAGIENAQGEKVVEGIQKKAFSPAVVFTKPINTSLKSLQNEIRLYPVTDTPGDKVYPLRDFTVSSSKSMVAFNAGVAIIPVEKESPNEIIRGPIIADLNKNGKVSNPRALVKLDIRESLTVPEFILGRKVLRATYSSFETPGVIDLRFFDLEKGQTELQSLSAAFEVKPNHIIALGDSYYYVRTQEKEMVLNYDPTNLDAKKVLFEIARVSEQPSPLALALSGANEKRITYAIVSQRKIEIVVEKIGIANPQVRITLDLSSGKIEKDLPPEAQRAAQYIQVQNNRQIKLLARITKENNPLKTYTVFELRNENGEITSSWQVEGLLLDSKAYFGRDGIVVEYKSGTSHSSYILLANNGSVMPVLGKLPGFQSLLYSSDTFFGLSPVRFDGTLDLSILPIVNAKGAYESADPLKSIQSIADMRDYLKTKPDFSNLLELLKLEKPNSTKLELINNYISSQHELTDVEYIELLRLMPKDYKYLALDREEVQAAMAEFNIKNYVGFPLILPTSVRIAWLGLRKIKSIAYDRRFARLRFQFMKVVEDMPNDNQELKQDMIKLMSALHWNAMKYIFK